MLAEVFTRLLQCPHAIGSVMLQLGILCWEMSNSIIVSGRNGKSQSNLPVSMENDLPVFGGRDGALKLKPLNEMIHLCSNLQGPPRHASGK